MRELDESSRFFRRGLGVVLLVAAAQRALYLAYAHSQTELFGIHILDSLVYEAMAERIAGGDLAADARAFRLAPLYAYFLALLRVLFGENLVVLYTIQQGLGLGSIALTGLIGRRCFGDRAGVAGAALIALYGAMAMLEAKLLSSTLAVFLSLLAIHGLLRASERGWGWRAIGPGLILGAACLARPNTLLFCPLAAAWVLSDERSALRASSGMQKRRLTAALWFALGVMIAIAPATIRNYRIEGELILISSQGGITFYQGNQAGSIGVYTRVPGLVAHPSRVVESQRRLAEREVGHALTRAEAEAYWRNKGVRFLIDNPGRATLLMARKLRYWLGSEEVSTEYVLSAERLMVPTLWLMPLPFGAILGLALLGVWRTGFGGSKERLLYLFLVSNLAAILIFYFQSRYRLPAVPVLATFAGCGLVEVLARLRDSPAAGLRFALVGLLATGLSLLPFSQEYERSEGAQFGNFATALSRNGHDAQAARFYQLALRGLGDSWQLHHFLALTYVRLEDLESAVRHHERALALSPDAEPVRQLLERERAALRQQTGDEAAEGRRSPSD